MNYGRPFNDEMGFVAHEMGLEEKQVQLLNEFKVLAKIKGQHFP
jgi:hypothetical protein